MDNFSIQTFEDEPMRAFLEANRDCIRQAIHGPLDRESQGFERDVEETGHIADDGGDLEENTQQEFTIKEFYKNVKLFGFIAGYQTTSYKDQDHANIKAAERMGKLHDKLKAIGYEGHDLEVYLVRLLFCLVAEDTSIFERRLFQDLIEQRTAQDGSDLAMRLEQLFQVLDAPQEKRLKNLDEQLAAFPYVNGSLFKERLPMASFDTEMLEILLLCCALDWSRISPTIFGTLFQSVMDQKLRRNLGAHYTNEENILKVINPLFMDDLRKELGKCSNSKQKLNAFHDRLATFNFFDPACGCGNFLVIAYRELRLLELEVIQKIWGNNLTAQIDADLLIRCNVHQFHGIEIDESAAQIATLALWLTDHQMNLKAKSLGLYYHRLPLKKKANIVCANALRINWADVIAPEQCSYIMGNPPFIGYSYQSKEQKTDLEVAFKGMNGAGVLDYVAAWHVTAARYIQANPTIPVAFVSTKSLSQGEQVAVLWTELLKLNIKLYFAHRTFRWRNEGKGIASVHCVIMGFFCDKGKKSLPPTACRLFDYGDDISGIPTEITAKQINPYLVDAPDIFVEKRRKPLNPNTPEMTKGNKPTDGGYLLLSQEEADNISENDPIAAKYIRPFLGAVEFINNIPRYCLWLKDSTSGDRLNSPEIKRRIEQVKKMRLASPKIPTQKLAETPYLFGEIRESEEPYLLIPCHSSENRSYIPIGYLSVDVICGNANFMLANASLYHFGILCSTFHNAWMRTVCGRLTSNYRYSNTIVYNNFPWPDVGTNRKGEKSFALTDKHQTAIETAAQAILDARTAEETRCAEHGQSCSLAQLYAPNNMPEALRKAHNQLDKAVDAAYGYKPNKAEGSKKDDAVRVAFLFERYQEQLAR